MKYFVASPCDYGRSLRISSHQLRTPKHKILHRRELFDTCFDAIYFHCTDILRDVISDGFEPDEFTETTLYDLSVGMLEHDYDVHEENCHWKVYRVDDKNVIECDRTDYNIDELKEAFMRLSKRLYHFIMYKHELDKARFL